MDLFFYVFGDSRENELMLLSVLNALYESISMILRKNVEKRAVFDQMDRLVEYTKLFDGNRMPFSVKFEVYAVIYLLTLFNFQYFIDSRRSGR